MKASLLTHRQPPQCFLDDETYARLNLRMLRMSVRTPELIAKLF